MTMISTEQVRQSLIVSVDPPVCPFSLRDVINMLNVFVDVYSLSCLQLLSSAELDHRDRDLSFYFTCSLPPPASH